MGPDARRASEDAVRGFVLPESRARVEGLLPRLVGDITFTTLSEVWGAALAVDAIVEHLRAEMEAVVVATHAADESAVAAYFDFAHALCVEHRLREMANEMAALWPSRPP